MTRIIFVSIAFLFSYNCVFSQVNDSQNIIEYNDLSYMSKSTAEHDSLQRLNLVLPKDKEDAPLFIWIGGGAWSYGDKNQETKIARKLGQEGIAVAVVGHRLSPAIWRDPKLSTGVQHPAHIKDVAAAVKWLYENAAKYRYSKDKIFIGGFSSGAHLAALISLDETYLAEKGLSTDLFKGIIPISGTYDILNYYEVMKNSNQPELAELHVQAVFSQTQEDFIKASPTSYLEHLSTPMLVMSDNNMYNYTRLLEDRIRVTDFRDMSVVHAYEFGHGALWRNMSQDEHSIYRNIIVDFIKKRSATEKAK